eukprot:TRINITY_DN4097_c0_g2_i1.p1 TRINITY_DN4097_c0_g2~~TRINITY_DN4097_c0_g2_i1.p1  ORF type:complete len:507 (+),score=64.21 TRINITY_DN4097_c0_g2_i1:72-1592(+)
MYAADRTGAGVFRDSRGTAPRAADARAVWGSASPHAARSPCSATPPPYASGTPGRGSSPAESTPGPLSTGFAGASLLFSTHRRATADPVAPPTLPRLTGAATPSTPASATPHVLTPTHRVQRNDDAWGVAFGTPRETLKPKILSYRDEDRPAYDTITFDRDDRLEQTPLKDMFATTATTTPRGQVREGTPRGADHHQEWWRIDGGVAAAPQSGRAVTPTPPPVPQLGAPFTALPPGWVDARDPTTGRIFYHNTRTKESVWERPVWPASAEGVLTATAVAPAKQPSPRRFARHRSPSMDWTHTNIHLLPPKARADAEKYTVVLDLDETVVYAREGPLVVRPGAQELVQLLGQHCETVIWTAGERSYAQLVLCELDPGNDAVHHCVYRHPKWFSGRPGQVKDLGLLNRPLDKTLLIDNTPDCIRRHISNSLTVTDFHGTKDDTALYTLAVLLRLLFASGKPVPEFLRGCPLAKVTSVRTDMGDYISVYGVGHGIESKDARVNHDTVKP